MIQPFGADAAFVRNENEGGRFRPTRLQGGGPSHDFTLVDYLKLGHGWKNLIVNAEVYNNKGTAKANIPIKYSHRTGECHY
jgi:hypothetical protein